MRNLKIAAVMMLAMTILGTTGATAQTVLNSNLPAQFAQAGFIQAATLDSTSPASGGTLTMNGVTMVVPANSVVQFPANTLTWAQLFDHLLSSPVYDPAVPTQATPSIAAGASGLAMADNAAQTIGTSPDLPFNAIVFGNIDVQNRTGRGIGAYIVGLILPINQDLGNGGAGFINFIDYAKGRFEVGGVEGVANTGTVIELNDPTGRYGFAHSPDPRWSVDPDNPTITSLNGYPMGIPKVAPPAIDPDRPTFNRRLNPPIGASGHDPFLQPGSPLLAYFMPASTAPGRTQPDPWKQAPFMVGDYVTYTGVLYSNNPAVPLDPTVSISRQTYISANTVTAGNLMIYTASGTAGTVGPAYIQIAGRAVIGNGGSRVTVPANATLGIQGGVIPNADPKLNIDIRGFCTDSTALVDIFAVDVDPTSGNQTLRKLGTALPNAGVGGVPAPKGVKGLWRLQVTKGNFLPVTRGYIARTRHGLRQLPPQTGTIRPADGLLAGQYFAPMFGFIFNEAVQGFPATPTNFNTVPFLTLGEGGNPSAGPLTPFPPSTP